MDANTLGITGEEKEKLSKELEKAIGEDSFWPFLLIMLAFCSQDWDVQHNENDSQEKE